MWWRQTAADSIRGVEENRTFFGFSDPGGNSWAVQELKLRGEKPLIPLDYRGRFGA